MNKRARGDKGEEAASQYLTNKGYEIIARNYYSRYGEIDIIAKHLSMIIFIEVKLRKNSNYGAGYESVTISKQDKLIKTAEIYIAENELEGTARFDVISIDAGVIKHIENAFTL